MPHDIKTFSQALAINPKILVKVSYKVHGKVDGVVTLNDMQCAPEVDNVFVLGLTDSIRLVSTVTDFTEGISGVEIISLTVNDYEVLPKYQHLSSHGTNYHDWIGTLSLDVSEPFYTWYHTATGQGWFA